MTTTTAQHLLLHFARNGAYRRQERELLVLERGEGPFVFDRRGRRYVDALSSLFCSQLGYSYGAEMAEAAAEQLGTLAFANLWSTAHPAALELADRLTALSPPGLDSVFFTSGGSESVETAWKLTRQYHVLNGEPSRTKAIARKVAYHGVTLGALALTGVEGLKAPFGDPAIDVRHVSTTSEYRAGAKGAELTDRLLAEIEQTILAEGPETIAMIIAEPVQNAGGCFTPPPGYWTGLRAIADRFGALLVSDEVITGFGRLGEWFGGDRFGARPHMVTMAKGLTSAYLPMGAVLADEGVASTLSRGDSTLLHGLTFAGHPACSAVALRNLEIFTREGVLENVRTLEPHFESRVRELLDLPIVGDVRGAGFFWAIELVQNAAGDSFDADGRERLIRGYLPGRLLEAGLIARPDDRGDPVLQLAPPLICDAATLDLIVDSVAEVLSDAGRFMHVEGAGS